MKNSRFLSYKGWEEEGYFRHWQIGAVKGGVSGDSLGWVSGPGAGSGVDGHVETPRNRGVERPAKGAVLCLGRLWCFKFGVKPKGGSPAGKWVTAQSRGAGRLGGEGWGCVSTSAAPQKVSVSIICALSGFLEKQLSHYVGGAPGCCAPGSSCRLLPAALNAGAEVEQGLQRFGGAALGHGAATCLAGSVRDTAMLVLEGH